MIAKSFNDYWIEKVFPTSLQSAGLLLMYNGLTFILLQTLVLHHVVFIRFGSLIFWLRYVNISVNEVLRSRFLFEKSGDC